MIKRIASRARCLALLLCSVLLLWTVSAGAADKRIETTVSGFEDIEYKQGSVKLNNFTIAEAKGGFMVPRGSYVVNIQLSGKNKSKKKNAKVQLQVVGLGKDGKVLWAATVKPVFGMIRKQKVAEIKGYAIAPRGTLRRTKKIVILIRGGMARY
jgi:hypothetical protein